jgi:hypothetical protein
MAAPFVEGRLRNEQLTMDIESSCAHCDDPIRIRVDSELHFECDDDVLLFEPSVDWTTFDEPNIIRRY